jgi:DNA modification methylase
VFSGREYDGIPAQGGDCIDVMNSMPPECVDLVVTSPPYDDLREYCGYAFLFDETVRCLFRVVRECGIVVWVVNDQTKNGSESGTSFRQALGFMKTGFNLHDTMIYQTDKPPMNHRRYQQSFEFMFVFSKGKPITFNPIRVPCKHAGESRKGITYRNPDGSLKETHSKGSIAPTKVKSNIWYFASGNMQSAKDASAFQHPAVFPEQLAEDHIVSWSNPGDIVFDPFVGSGTTALAALRTGRHFFGCDVSPEYVEIARARITAENADLRQRRI